MIQQTRSRSPLVFPAFPEMLSYHARAAPDRTAILAPGHPQLTYGALWRSTKNVVHGLRRMGVGRTDRVAVVLPAWPKPHLRWLLVIRLRFVCLFTLVSRSSRISIVFPSYGYRRWSRAPK